MGIWMFNTLDIDSIQFSYHVHIIEQETTIQETPTTVHDSAAILHIKWNV